MKGEFLTVKRFEINGLFLKLRKVRDFCIGFYIIWIIQIVMLGSS